MTKTKVESCLRLDVNRIHRDKRGRTDIRPGLEGTITWSDGNRIGMSTHANVDEQLYIRLSFSKKGEDITQEVPIVFTDMPNGGRRPWFICPVTKHNAPCQRRVGKLYLPYYGKLFACRHCYELTYESQQDWVNPKMKALIRSMQLMDEIDHLAEDKRPSRRKTERVIEIYHQLNKNLRKAGIKTYGFEETD